MPPQLEQAGTRPGERSWQMLVGVCGWGVCFVFSTAELLEVTDTTLVILLKKRLKKISAVSLRKAEINVELSFSPCVFCCVLPTDVVPKTRCFALRF